MRRVALALLLAASPAAADAGFRINQATMDAGASDHLSGGPWTLSGTIGQGEPDPAAPLQGGRFALTPGVWSQLIPPEPRPEPVFLDGFEPTQTAEDQR